MQILNHWFQCWVNLGNWATVSLVTDPVSLEGERVFDGSDASVGVPSKDEPPSVRHGHRGVCPPISRHFPQHLWKEAPRTLENILLHKHDESWRFS